MSVYSHTGFLKAVLLHTFSAFGGPQGHYAMMLHSFVEKRQDLTQKELVDLNAFCQLLPGASSTQLLVLIGYKKGGFPLALCTLLIWILPATCIMGLFSILFTQQHLADPLLHSFRYLQPMAVGFIAFATYVSLRFIYQQKPHFILSLTIGFICLVFYKSPLVFPVVLIMGGVSSYFFSKKSAVVSRDSPMRIRWVHLTFFIIIFILAGSLSGLSKREEWSSRPYFNLFENCYRFGSIVFGGGDVMIPLMYEQYVARPTSKRVKTQNQNVLKIEQEIFLSGAGIVRSIPGPVFSIAAFAGGASLKGKGILAQCIGILTATFAIFLPSLLLSLFFLPLWDYLHRFDILTPFLQGIHASTIGIMTASSLYLIKAILIPGTLASFNMDYSSILIILATVWFLKERIFHPALIAMGCLLLGILM